MLISLKNFAKTKLSITQTPSSHRYSRSAVTLVLPGLFALLRMPVLMLFPRFRREYGFVAVTGGTRRTKAWIRNRNVRGLLALIPLGGAFLTSHWEATAASQSHTLYR